MTAKFFKLTLISLFCFCICIVSANANIETKSNEIANINNENNVSDDIVRSEKAQLHYDEIKEVLGREEFGKTKYKKAWRKIDTSDKETREDKFPEWVIKLLEWLEDLNPPDNRDGVDSLPTLASMIEVLFWLIAIGLVVFVLVKYHKEIKGLARMLGQSKTSSHSLPATMFGLDIKKESLPEDIIVTAKQYWGDGEVRSAIALLLRASLIKLLNEHECRFYDSDTEAECCLRIDKQAPKVLSDFMRNLVSVWQQVAYAHRSPTQDKFDNLCAQWQEVF